MVFFSIVIITLFFLKALIFLDPDFGWHLASGQYILSHGIPATDPFSYTMSSFPFIDHEWLTNVLLRNLYQTLGIPGLTAIYTSIALLAIFAAWKRNTKHLKFWEVPVVLGIAILFSYFGIRPQVESWLLWAVFLLVVFNEKIWIKWRYLLPVFFIVWTNFHASFAVGIVSLLLIGIIKFWEKRKIDRDILLVFILSTIATFVNPYGPRIWIEVWQQVSNTSLRWQILEWQPAFFSFNLPFVVYAVLSVFLIWKNRKKFELSELGLYFFFLLQGIASTRHVPLWSILSLPMTIKGFNYTLDEVRKIPLAKIRFFRVYKFSLYGALIIMVFQFLLGFNSALELGEYNFYPRKAAIYIKKNSPSGEIFSEYGWGGYLIWNIPEKKVFIDGRMPSWRYKNNPLNESDNAMRDYIDLLNGKIDYKKVFEKYNVGVVLWPKERPPRLLDVLSQRLANLISKQKEPFSLIGELKKDGWQRVYEDEVAVIYEKPQ